LQDCPGSRGFALITHSDQEGAFSFEGVPTGSYEIHAMADELGRITQRLGLVNRNIDGLRLQLPGHIGGEEHLTVSGVVEDEADEPVDGAHVILLGVPECPRSRLFGEVTHTNNDGEFVFEEVNSGGYNIHAMAEGLGWTWRRLGFIDQDINDVQLQLPGQSQLFGGNRIAYEPCVLEFTDVEVGALQSLPITIRNTDQGSIDIQSQYITPEDSPFFVSLGGGAVTLQPNSKHLMWISFAPYSPVVYEAVLQIWPVVDVTPPIEVALRGSVLSVKSNPQVLKDYTLEDVYPNPFNSAANISIQLAKPSRILLRVWDLSGRPVSTLIEGERPVGHFRAVWNAQTAPMGIYFVSLEAEDFSTARKVLLVK